MVISEIDKCSFISKMKFRVNYRLSRGLFISALLFSVCLFFPYFNRDAYNGDPFQLTIGLCMFFGWFPLLFLILSFFSTRQYAIYDEQLTTHYIFGLLPRTYDLRQLNGIETIDKDMPKRVGNLLVAITLSSRFYRLRWTKIHFGNESLKINGNTIHSSDYSAFLKRLKHFQN